jgi:CHASE2 domain-containing sensor protein
MRKRAGAVARKVGRGVVRHGKEHTPAVSLAIGGLIVGALDGRGLLNKIPTIGGSRAMTLGIAGYLVTRFVKHPMARNAGLAALAAAAYDYGKVHLGSGGGSSSAAVAPVPPPAGKGTVGGHDDPSGSRGDGGPY